MATTQVRSAEALRTDPRFPGVPAEAGHYESFFLKLSDPPAGVGAWIRHTVHKRPGARAVGSLWFTLFDASAGGPTASKVTLPPEELSGGGDRYIEIGDSRLEPGHAVGRAQSGACDASWDLRFESPEPPYLHLPRDWMYGAPVPRTKLLSPYPAARFTGSLTVDGRQIEVDGWPGAIGHNWGAQHAERWIWMHGAGFEGFGADTWLDAAVGRIKLGPVTLPWIANARLSLDGAHHRLGGPERLRSTKVAETPQGCDFVLPGREVSVYGKVSAARKSFVGWVYADPDGPEHHTVNCSIAEMRLTVSRPDDSVVTLETAHGAAYELGMREKDHGMPIQPFPDG